jgi:drug/metabolite transporter (DMT)-like permease
VVGMFVVLGVLLSIAGVALLRRAAIAATLAQVAAVVWLVLAVVVRVVHPVMSIAAMLLAVVFPIALLLHLWITRGRRTRTGPA